MLKKKPTKSLQNHKTQMLTFFLPLFIFPSSWLDSFYLLISFHLFSPLLNPLSVHLFIFMTSSSSSLMTLHLSFSVFLCLSHHPNPLNTHTHTYTLSSALLCFYPLLQTPRKMAMLQPTRRPWPMRTVPPSTRSWGMNAAPPPGASAPPPAGSATPTTGPASC